MSSMIKCDYVQDSYYSYMKCDTLIIIQINDIILLTLNEYLVDTFNKFTKLFINSIV